MNRKDIQKSVWDRAFDNLDEEGNLIQEPRKIKTDTSVLISTNNKRTWANPEIRKKRSQGIKKTRQKNGSLTDEQKLKCYEETFGPDKNNGLYEKLSKKYSVGINYINHIGSNFENIVSKEIHEKNLQEWNEKYGFFGHWKIYSPGINLLGEYDAHWKNNMIPPSAIFYIRFELANASPKEIRDYLKPWTNNDILKYPDGRIANARYIGFRKKQYSFLTEEIGEVFDFHSMEEIHIFLKKFYGNNLTRTYTHQILRGSRIKEDGPMVGWMFEKIK